MKKSLVALAALAATGAFAQVTVTGTVSMGWDATSHSTLDNPVGRPSPNKAGNAAQFLNLNTNSKPVGDASGLGVDTAELNFKAVEDLGSGYTVVGTMQFDTVSRTGVVGGDTTLTLVTPVGALALQSVRVPDWLSVGPASIGQVSMDARTNTSRGFQDAIAFVTKLAPTVTLTLSHGENAQFAATTAGLGLGSGAAGANGTSVGALGQAQRNNGIAIVYRNGPLVANAQYLNYDQQTDGYDLSIKNVTRAQASYDFGPAKLFGGAINTALAGGATLVQSSIAVAVPVNSWNFTGSVNGNVLTGTAGYIGPVFAQPVAALGGASVYQALGCSNTTGCGANSLDSTTSGYTLSAQYNFSKTANVSLTYRSWNFAENAKNRDTETALLLTKTF
jgi:hypothetical protein